MSFQRSESRVASEIARLLRDVPLDAELAIEPLSELCSSLERFVPQLLFEHYDEWRGESLDGVYVARATKTTSHTLSLLGTCILISDQTVVPFYAAFAVNASRDAIESFEISIGEPGGGPLGISGPPCGSGQATRLHHRLPARFDLGRIEWVYKVASGARPTRVAAAFEA